MSLPYVRDPVHLGHKITSNLSTKDDIESQFCMFTRRANAVLSNFYMCDCLERVNLLHTYTSSFYGSQLWDLRQVKCLEVGYRKALRRALGVSTRAHTRLLPIICKRPSLIAQLVNRFLKFLTC